MRIAGGDNAGQVQPAAEIVLPPQCRPALLLPEWMHSRWMLVFPGTDLPTFVLWWDGVGGTLLAQRRSVLLFIATTKYSDFESEFGLNTSICLFK